MGPFGVVITRHRCVDLQVNFITNHPRW